MNSPGPAVGLVGAWFDPADLRTWSGMFAHVIDELQAIGVYAGFRDAAPVAPASRLVHRVLTAAGGSTGNLPLRTPMRLAARASAPVVRRRPPAAVDAWIVPAGTLGRPVTGPQVAWCELSPTQLARLGPAGATAFGLPGVSAGQLRAVVAAHRRLHRRARASCAVSFAAARSLVIDDGLDARRVHVVGCGRNIEPDGPVERDWSAPRFLFVGNDWARKNGDAVLRAFTRLRADHPGAHLDVAGGHPPLDVKGVIAHGPLRLDQPADRQRLQSLFAGATCFVMPSRAEPFGIVYVEAASFGVPSIGSASGGPITAIGDGGVLVEPGDDEALLAAMRRLADPAEARRLGQRALARSTRFTWRKVAERLYRATGLPAPDGVALAEFLDADPDPSVTADHHVPGAGPATDPAAGRSAVAAAGRRTTPTAGSPATHS